MNQEKNQTKKEIKNPILRFVKNETVLSISILLAVISCFFVHPDKEYIGYIDFRTLAILASLMAVMGGASQIGVFDVLAKALLNSVKHLRSIIFVLVLLCFFFSMIITNDVALITFVPLTMIVLRMLGKEYTEKWMIPIVVMQTIAANLGSMLTPLGNPQNLYLYGQAKMSVGAFLLLMLPYTALAFLLLFVWIFLITRNKNQKLSVDFAQNEQSVSKGKCILYGFLFMICLLTVARVLPYWVTLLIVVIVVAISDREVLKKLDYALLFTFVGFFVFIGNMGRVDMVHQFLQSMIGGREVIVSVIASQGLSNVPTALLLSGFTDQYKLLIIGTNLGGLGTLIASMASLISFKYVGREDKAKRGRYVVYFSIANIVFLLIEIALYYGVKYI